MRDNGGKMTKTKEKEVKDKCKEYGLTLLSKYINSTTALHLKDKDGYEYSLQFQNLKNRKNKNIISGRYNSKNIYKEKNINKYMKKEVKNKTKIITISQKIDTEEFIFKCGICNKEFLQLWKIFINNNPYHCCQKCSLKLKKKKKIGIEKIRKIFSKNGYILLENEDKGTHNAYYVKDKFGYIGRMLVYSSNKKKYGVEKFNNKNKYTFQNMDLFFKRNKIPLLCSKKNTEFWNEKPFLVICECGREFSVTIDNIKNGQIKCKFCRHSISKNETFIQNFLTENKVNFKFQYKISNYMNYKNLFFDFYLPNYNLFIEVDGEQHERPIRFNGIKWEKALENFNKGKKRDKAKELYCYEYGINLVRVNYRDIKNGNYKNILNSIIRKD